jgi:hypothetical protein
MGGCHLYPRAISFFSFAPLGHPSGHAAGYPSLDALCSLHTSGMSD